MTLNEGLKAISKDPYNLVLSHITWSPSKFIQMSCNTHKSGGIDGISSGPMTLKVISTIEQGRYTEEPLRRKELKDEKYNNGWVIIDNNTLVKRITSGEKDNISLQDKNDIGHLEVVLKEAREEYVFSSDEDVLKLKEYCISLGIMRSTIDYYLFNIDNAMLPKENSVTTFLDSLLQYTKNKKMPEDKVANKIIEKVNELFPNTIGLDESDIELAKNIELKYKTSLNIDKLKSLPRKMAKDILNNRIVFVLNENVFDKKKSGLKNIFKKIFKK